jgi:hypothetical protein
MDPPLFHLAPSGDVPLLTLRISRSLFPNMAIAPEMAAAGLVCPFRVKSVSESKKSATAFGGTCERCPPAWATFTRGVAGEHAA